MPTTTDDIAALFELFLEHISQEKPAQAANYRCLLNQFRGASKQPATIEDFVRHHEEWLVDMETTGTITAGTIRPLRSRVREAASWAYGEGFVRFSPDHAVMVGLPPADQFARWDDNPRALTAYKLLISDMVYFKRSASDLDEAFMASFQESLEGRVSNWRNCWSALAVRWRELAEEGSIPDVDLPPLASARRTEYALVEASLPPHLADEVSRIRTHLLGKSIAKRQGRRPHRGSTVALAISTFLRLLGYLAQEEHVDLHGVGLADVLALSNARKLIGYTNRRAMALYGIEPGSREQLQYGEYELGTLVQLLSIVRVGLCDEALCAEYLDEVRHLAPLVRKRRESAKEPGTPDDYLRVALHVWSSADPRRWENGGAVRCALLRRDAAIIAILAVLAYRRAVIANMQIGKHLRRGNDTAPSLFCIPKTETKPGLRDLQHELPAEFLPMVDTILADRVLLLDGGEDQGYLWVGQGGAPLSDAAIYAAFRKHTAEVLGTPRNPHQCRKAWATSWGKFSGGDFLTASAVLDSSPLVIQRHYHSLRMYEMHREHDAAVLKAWDNLDDGGHAHGNG